MKLILSKVEVESSGCPINEVSQEYIESVKDYFNIEYDVDKWRVTKKDNLIIYFSEY